MKTVGKLKHLKPFGGLKQKDKGEGKEEKRNLILEHLQLDTGSIFFYVCLSTRKRFLLKTDKKSQGVLTNPQD
jgi:hypothetical protein